MNPLSSFTTQQLVDELSKREGVRTEVFTAENEVFIEVQDLNEDSVMCLEVSRTPATLLVVEMPRSVVFWV